MIKFCSLCRRPRTFADKSETQPFLNSSAASPTQPMLSGSSTINRTLLHHQQQSHHDLAVVPGGGNTSMSSSAASGILGGGGGGGGTIGGGATNRNGLLAIRGLAYSGESPPPDYNIVVHERHGLFSFFLILIS